MTNTFSCIRTALITGLFFLLIITPYLSFASAPQPKKCGCLEGKVTDAESGAGIGWTTLYLEEIDRSVSAHENGDFHFFELPAGTYTLKIYRIGYIDATMNVTIKKEVSTHLDIKMTSSGLSLEAVVVEGIRGKNTSDIEKAEIVISDKKLRQNLSPTIAETIEGEPGLAMRSMGPAPARPVLRGMGNDRLLVLEDGERTGDLSATSSDHAVGIDPLSAERIEVIRGPEALMYGANAIGGVVNVERDYIPNDLPHRLQGSALVQTESVNRGYSGGLHFHKALNSLSLRMDGSYRDASDMNTPDGELKNTAITTHNTALGASFVKPWGYLGVSGSIYDSDYGIPPDPFGGHPGGVSIDMEKKSFKAKSEIHTPVSGIKNIEINYSYSDYYHAEYEANGNVGMDFIVKTHNYSALFNFPTKGAFKKLYVGVWGEYRDYATGGLSFTPPSEEFSQAIFVYNEMHWGKFQTNASIRFDHKSINPAYEKMINRADYIMHIRGRDFSDIATSVSALYAVRKNLDWGATIMKTFRAPGIEELFSEGPHLASYAYEVGNSQLKKERGIGLETFIDYKKNYVNLHLALFRNEMFGYIFPKNTGRESLRRADLMLYQYVGKHVVFKGFEAFGEYKFLQHYQLEGNVSYVNGSLVNEDEPLPEIPPLQWNLGLRYAKGAFSIGAKAKGAMEQERLGQHENLKYIHEADPNVLVPDPYVNIGGNYYLQTPTEAYTIFNLESEYFFNTDHFLHTLTFGVENILDTKYRQHLNRIKFIMPEPGRNFKLLYKLHF